MSIYTLAMLAGFAYLVHLVGRRAQKHGRRYWPWALASFFTGPMGMLIVFLILESRHHKDLERLEPEPADQESNGSTAVNIYPPASVTLFGPPYLSTNFCTASRVCTAN